jgi:predicted kinase
VLANRLRGRAGDASDATADVLERQLRSPVGEIDWHRLDGSLEAIDVQRRAEAHLSRA